MKTKVSPAVVGLFVLGALGLALIALFSFGGVNFFSKPQRFVIYFDESIHGLDLGSPVKLRGVRVGRVVDLNIRYDAAKNQSVVAVLCELNRNMIMDRRGEQVDVSEKAELQAMIDGGLRGQLGIIGLATGLLFVELDFLDPAEYPAKPTNLDVRYAEVPAVPSTISEFQANFSEILTDVKKIDFAGLSREVRDLLAESRRQLATANLAALTEQWTKTGEALYTLAASPEIKQLLVNLDGATSALHGLLAKIESQVDPTSDKLGQALAQLETTLETFDGVLATARRLLASQHGLGDEAARALQQLAEAASSVQRLADYLERNPNALLTGRKASP